MNYSFLNFSRPVIMYAIANIIIWFCVVKNFFFKTFDIGQNNIRYLLLFIILFILAHLVILWMNN